MIPEAKQTAVANALQAAFGVSEFEEIRQLTVGLSSALIYRIVVQGKPYLLRVITRTDAMSDPTHFYNCMKPAAEAGIAPQIWHAGIDDRISITDFIEAKAFPIQEARIKLPLVLKRLHSLPPFPSRINYLDFANSSIRKFYAANLLPENITGQMFRQYERIASVYPRNNDDLVASHNDLKPDNILFDGNRVWLVDWESAFLNDRYLDLSVIANFVVMDDNDETEYLKRYFGDDFTEYRQARFFLMRQLLHMIYFAFFMSLSTAGGMPVDLTMAKPDFREFHDRLWEGKIYLLDTFAQQQYAWVHLEQLQHNLLLPRFEEALRIVGDQS